MAEVISHFRPDVLQAEPCDGILDAVSAGFAILPVFHDSPDLVAQIERFWESLGSRSAVLLEASGRGGRGVAPDWQHAAQIAHVARLVLAGGLASKNVGAALQQVRPYAVDVSSGVESSKGIKDARRIAEFIQSVHQYAAPLNAESRA